MAPVNLSYQVLRQLRAFVKLALILKYGAGKGQTGFFATLSDSLTYPAI